jgi:hypothetical protein
MGKASIKIRRRIRHIRDAGSHKGPIRRELATTVIVQQKRLSDKMSWCHYDPHQTIYDSNDPGRPYRFHYRINVYEKVLN